MIRLNACVVSYGLVVARGSFSRSRYLFEQNCWEVLLNMSNLLAPSTFLETQIELHFRRSMNCLPNCRQASFCIN